MHTFIEIIKNHIQYKQQIFKLAKADLIKTYRGAALGWSWAVIKPAVTIFVYWFTFQVGIKSIGKEVEGFPYFLWLISGLIPWFYINDMLTQGIESIRKYSYLVTKMKFPISTIPTFVSISKLLVNLFLIIIMILIFVFMGYAPDIYVIQLPIYILLSFLMFTVFALLASILACMSKDFSNLIKSLVTAVFWLSGIVWNVNTIDIPWLKVLLKINPVTYIVEGFRNCFIHKVWIWESLKTLICFLAILIVLTVLAVVLYKKLRKEIPDVLN